jgi:hypothetical protein
MSLLYKAWTFQHNRDEVLIHTTAYSFSTFLRVQSKDSSLGRNDNYEVLLILNFSIVVAPQLFNLNHPHWHNC